MSHKNIDNILNSLQGATRATASPYLLTRVNVALGEEKAEQSIWGWLVSKLRKPQVAFSLLFAVLLINVFVLMQSNTTSDYEAVAKTATGSGEFAINIKSNYDIDVNE